MCAYHLNRCLIRTCISYSNRLSSDLASHFHFTLLHGFRNQDWSILSRHLRKLGQWTDEGVNILLLKMEANGSQLLFSSTLAFCVAVCRCCFAR